MVTLVGVTVRCFTAIAHMRPPPPPQERTAAGTVRAVHSQQAGRGPQHANYPQHPTGRRRSLHLQGYQQGRVSGEGALPQSVR